MFMGVTRIYAYGLVRCNARTAQKTLTSVVCVFLSARFFAALLPVNSEFSGRFYHGSYRSGGHIVHRRACFFLGWWVQTDVSALLLPVSLSRHDDEHHEG